MFDNSIGIYGKMGKVISLYQLYERTNVEEWKTQANDLLDEIFALCQNNISLSYNYGLLGVGTGIEWLFQKGFLNGNPDIILADIDMLAITAIIKRIIPKTEEIDGLIGLVCYLYYRLHYRKNEETIIVLTLKEHVLYLIDWIIEKVQNSESEKDIYEYYFMLVLLHQLDVCNAKVVNVLKWCNDKVEEIKNK